MEYMKGPATAKIVLCKQWARQLPDGTKLYPLRIRITFRGKSRFYRAGTDVFLSDEEFSANRTKKVKDAVMEASRLLMKARDLCACFASDFVWEQFDEAYSACLNDAGGKAGGTARELVKETRKAAFADVLSEYLSVADLSESSRGLYDTTGRWIERYRPGVKVADIDEDFLTGFKRFVKDEHLNDPKCKGRDMSENTLRIYLRNVKAIINYAIKKGRYDGRNPFSQLNGQPLTSVPRQKAAMRENDFWRLIDYVPQTRDEEFGKDFFLATIQLSGANLGDILRLRNGDIADGEVNYIRRKSRRSGIITSPPLTPGFLEFLQKYGRVDGTAPDSLILPFLAGLNTEKKIRQRIKWVNRRINKGIHSICGKLGIRDMTVYNARHTFASYAVSNGLGIEAIQRFLGHSDVKTTRVYISSITDTEKDRDRTFLNTLNGKAPQI